ncbi:hypothetical protein [Croceimicrobium hydrocarbonivorans]|uniref:Uncharacterized protein n=1 Tax=Croceimicrobium hydrocarbonivorans TaxID=2761580 RepID=A0A7H0VH30_9FLAO|nr:hypothetical protein [Croceimicrobium hydrocarbonivorans]QNR25028.1 hypothetical protein H4K34_04055 [Croceimicrobium hydrocarbonivorans]
MDSLLLISDSLLVQRDMDNAQLGPFLKGNAFTMILGNNGIGDSSELGLEGQFGINVVIAKAP